MPEVAPDAEVLAGLHAPQPKTLKTPQQAATDADAPPTARAMPGRSRRTTARPAAPAEGPATTYPMEDPNPGAPPPGT